jgi:hypothetical protein
MNSLCLWNLPFTVAARSKAWTVFLVQTFKAWMSVCVYSLLVLSCVGSGLATGWSPIQGVLSTVLGLRHWSETKCYTDALCFKVGATGKRERDLWNLNPHIVLIIFRQWQRKVLDSIFYKQWELKSSYQRDPTEHIGLRFLLQGTTYSLDRVGYVNRLSFAAKATSISLRGKWKEWNMRAMVKHCGGEKSPSSSRATD